MMDATETGRLDGKLVTMITVAVVALIAVVAGAFVLSFDAITAVSEAAHIDDGLSWLMPVGVDGAMTVGTMAALVLKMLGKKTGYAWIVVLAGVVISIACNALHATQSEGTVVKLTGWQQGAVSAIPAVALALSLHLLIILIEAISEAVGERRKPRTDAVVEPVREPVRAPLTDPVRTVELPRTEVRTTAPYATRTEPVRSDGSSLVRTTRTELPASVRQPRTGDNAAPEPARTDVQKPAPARETAPPKDVKPPKTLVKETPAPIDRDALVTELARDITARGDDWKPDYDALMARAGFGRSWCEKAVKDARAVARKNEAAQPRTDDPYGLRADDEKTRTGAPYETRTGEVEETRTDDDEAPRTEPVRTQLRAVN
jgi:hypothetical protein